MELLILTIIITVAHWLSPFWWWILVLPFLYGVIRPSRGVRAFWIPALAAGLSWLLASLYFWQSFGEFIGPRVAVMLKVGQPFYLILIAGAIGFICGGISGLAGFYIRNLFRREQPGR